MQWQNSGTRYGVPAQTLHWGIVLLLLILFPLGWYMTGLPLGLEKFEARAPQLPVKLGGRFWKKARIASRESCVRVAVRCILRSTQS